MKADSKFEETISTILITGVSISLLLEIIGIFIFYHSYGHLDILEDKGMFIRGQDFFTFISELFRGGYTQKKGMFPMVLGITILILTPYARVILSVFYFLWKKDIKYTLITIFVFIILTLSLTGHL